MNGADNSKNPVILFITETGIYPFLRGHAILGDAVKKQGGNVFITHCNGQMLRCPMMTMYNLPVAASQEKKDVLCKKCAKYFKCIQKKYKFSSIELSNFVNEKLLKDIDDLVNKKKNDLDNINYRGFPVGKIAQYDFILETKFPYSTNLSESHEAIYSQYIKNTALAVTIADNICEYYKPSLLLTFNEYAQCQAVRHSANMHGVARMAFTYPVHFNIDASRFMIWKSTCEYWRYTHFQKWNNGKNIPIAVKHVDGCWDDTIFRMYGSGSHIFSVKKKSDPAAIFKILKLDSNKKIIIVYTSTQDERGSVEIAMNMWGEDPGITDAFKNQIDWLEMLRDYASQRKDIQIVVRIHPREGKRRSGFDSQHLLQIKAKFIEDTPNFIIIWPDDPVSSYDLMELADICLVTWSLMGQEAARLGIPVLACTGNMSYPDDDFIQVATTIEEYKRKLGSMLNMEYTWKHLIKAVRYYHWRIFIPSLDLGETVPADFDDTAIWPEAPLSKVQVINDILSGKQDLIENNIKQWQNSLSPDAAARESEAMRGGIRLFLDKLFFSPNTYGKKIDRLIYICGKIWRKFIRRYLYKLIGKPIPFKNTRHPFVDYRLEFTTDTARLEEFRRKTKHDKNLRILMADELDAILIHKGKMIRRMSPMVVRLARLHDNSLINKELM